MKKFKVLARCLSRDEEGVTLVEYGIGIALAIAVGTGALAALSTTINGRMGAAGTAMTIPAA